MNTFKSKKWVCAMTALAGTFGLQVAGMPMDPIVSGSIFTFLTVYVAGQSYVDKTKDKK